MKIEINARANMAAPYSLISHILERESKTTTVIWSDSETMDDAAERGMKKLYGPRSHLRGWHVERTDIDSNAVAFRRYFLGTVTGPKVNGGGYPIAGEIWASINVETNA
jgi:hypothetical protein